VTQVVEQGAPARTPTGGVGWSGRLGHVVTVAVAIGLGLAVWQLLSMQYDPAFLPGPADTARSAVELAADGTLVASAVASMQRIGAGWGLGLVIGVPLGLVIGQVRLLRRLLDPYLQFFRFVPPISFVTMSIIWFGIGDASKIFLIFYTTVFVVVLSTTAGVASVDPLRLQAARSLGASRTQVVRSVVVPSVLPHIVVGARLAMGNSFLTIVSAEIVAAETGVGALIWTARNYGQTEWVFVGIVMLGVLGLLCDLAIRLITRLTLHRFEVPS
jgi:NitT/TauT family transport system permease protein